jgi:hypothetical protein
MKAINFIYVCLLTIIFSGCEDVVDLNLKGGESQLAIDGQITNEPGPDTVLLTKTTPYLDNNNPIIGVENALVIVSDNLGAIDTLQHIGNGKYITDILEGKIGNKYSLEIQYQGETYRATTEMKRVPPIDSLKTDYRPEELFGRPPGYYVDFFASDIPGTGDTYRLKVYKNGKLHNRPRDLNLAYDASQLREGTDGVRFTFPIREMLNPFPNDNENKPPYNPGDTVTVELLSITEDHFNFYFQLLTQLNNGGLFASPPVNVSTNIYNANPSSDQKAVGWFGASAISRATVTIQ